MRKFLPVVFCGLAAISYGAFAADSSVKTDANTADPTTSNSKESSIDQSANPDTTTQGSASTGASTDKPAKRDMSKPKREKKSSDASSGASTAPAAPGTSGQTAPTPGAPSSEPSGHGASGSGTGEAK